MKEGENKLKINKGTGLNCIKYNMPDFLYQHRLASHKKVLWKLCHFFMSH